jgi:hypothetical protein
MEQTDSKITVSDQATPPVPELTGTSAEAESLQSKSPANVEEIDSSEPVKPVKPVAKTTVKKDEPIPNPLLEDPYEWERCTITVIYALLPDRTASISVYSHKDEPIIKTFTEAEVLLPLSISNVMEKLREIWPTNTITATMVLMPKVLDTTERTIVTSIRAGGDTPIVQTDVEGNVSFPAQIIQMFDELKAALPGRALKHIEKSAKTKTASVSKPAVKLPAKQTTPAPNATNKSQLSLF